MFATMIYVVAEPGPGFPYAVNVTEYVPASLNPGVHVSVPCEPLGVETKVPLDPGGSWLRSAVREKGSPSSSPAWTSTEIGEPSKPATWAGAATNGG